MFERRISLARVLLLLARGARLIGPEHGQARVRGFIYLFVFVSDLSSFHRASTTNDMPFQVPMHVRTWRFRLFPTFAVFLKGSESPYSI